MAKSKDDNNNLVITDYISSQDDDNEELNIVVEKNDEDENNIVSQPENRSEKIEIVIENQFLREDEQIMIGGEYHKLGKTQQIEINKLLEPYQMVSLKTILNEQKKIQETATYNYCKAFLNSIKKLFCCKKSLDEQQIEADKKIFVSKLKKIIRLNEVGNVIDIRNLKNLDQTELHNIVEVIKARGFISNNEVHELHKLKEDIELAEQRVAAKGDIGLWGWLATANKVFSKILDTVDILLQVDAIRNYVNSYIPFGGLLITSFSKSITTIDDMANVYISRKKDKAIALLKHSKKEEELRAQNRELHIKAFKEIHGESRNEYSFSSDFAKKVNNINIETIFYNNLENLAIFNIVAMSHGKQNFVQKEFIETLKFLMKAKENTIFFNFTNHDSKKHLKQDLVAVLINEKGENTIVLPMLRTKIWQEIRALLMSNKITYKVHKNVNEPFESNQAPLYYILAELYVKENQQFAKSMKGDYSFVYNRLTEKASEYAKEQNRKEAEGILKIA